MLQWPHFIVGGLSFYAKGDSDKDSCHLLPDLQSYSSRKYISKLKHLSDFVWEMLRILEAQSHTNYSSIRPTVALTRSVVLT